MSKLSLAKDLREQTHFSVRFKTQALNQQNVPEKATRESSFLKTAPRSGYHDHLGRVSERNQELTLFSKFQTANIYYLYNKKYFFKKKKQKGTKYCLKQHLWALDSLTLQNKPFFMKKLVRLGLQSSFYS